MFPQNYILVVNITILYLKCIVTIMLLYASDRYIQFWYASENIIKQIICTFTVLDIRFITTLGMTIFHSACGLVEYCIPRVVINLDIQHSSVQYLT